MAEPGRIGGRLPTQMLIDQSILTQPDGADYAHPITTRPPRFSDLSPSLVSNIKKLLYLAVIPYSPHSEIQYGMIMYCF